MQNLSLGRTFQSVQWQQESNELKPAPGQTPGAYFSFYQSPLPLELSKAGCCSTCTSEPQGYLESTSAAEDKNSWVSAALWSKETPRASDKCWKADQKVPVPRGVHMPGSQGTGAADVSHVPLGPPCPSFSPPFQNTDTAGVTAIYSCMLSCALGNQHSLTFSSKLPWSLILIILSSSSVLPRVLTLSGLSGRCWASLSQLEPLQLSGGLDALPVSPDTTHMLLYDYWWILDSSEKL